MIQVASRPDSLVKLSFLTLSMICLWNLNGITAVAFGIFQLMSAAILLCSVVIFFRTAGVASRSLGVAGVWFIGALCMYLLVGVLGNRDRGLFFTYFNSIIVIGASALASYHYACRNHAYRMIVMLMVIAVMGAATVFLSPFLGSVYDNTKTTQMVKDAGRWTGFFANPNETGFAGVYAFGLCLSVWLMPGGTTRLKKYLPLICIVLGIGVVLTFSRSAIISFLALGIGFAIFGVRMGRRAVWTLVIAVWVGAAGYWFFTTGYKEYEWKPEQLRRIRSVEKLLTFQYTTENERGGRIAGSLGGIEYWTESPIIGHGLKSMHEMPVRFFGGTGVHNTHIMVLGESGLIGFSVYLVALIVWIVYARRIDDPAVRNYCQLLWFTFLLVGMVSHDALGDRNFNLLAGVAFGLIAAMRGNRRMPQGYVAGYPHRPMR
jgi:O-Antigen ligase